ncbi:MAG: RNA polymerase subunit sigma-70, partial [Acidobacteria bacterium]|nr:RNA polymerase subunit sigma-70 [Acidobacteriota bacterium]
LEPMLESQLQTTAADPADIAVGRESIRLAFVAALQHLPPRQRAALLLTEVLGWSAAEVAESLATSVAAVNSALQRARATLAARDVTAQVGALTDEQTGLLDRYVEAFHEYDVDGLVTLLREDAALSMPPYTLWLRGHEPIRSWLLGRGIGCRGSRLVPVEACGSPAFAQYRRAAGGSHQAWALIVLELSGGQIASWTSFLDVEALFPTFGLPIRLAA